MQDVNRPGRSDPAGRRGRAEATPPHEGEVAASLAKAPPGGTPDVSIILVTYNNAALVEPLRASIEAAANGLTLQIICVDNASRDDTVNVLRERMPEIELIENTVNVGFGRANNQAWARATGRFVLLLNTDAFMAPNALVDCIAFMERMPECGLIGARLVGADGGPQPSCRFFPTPGNLILSEAGVKSGWIRRIDDPAIDLTVPQICDWVPGCFYFLRRTALDAVGLFDPRYFMYYEEVDHCRRLKRAGWTTICLPSVTVVHLGGESSRPEGALNSGKQLTPLQTESELLYLRKNFGLLALSGWLLAKLALLALKWGARRGRARRTDGLSGEMRLIVRSLFATRLATRATR